MAEEILVGLRDFLVPYLPLINSHNVDYLTRHHWTVYVPECVRREPTVNLYDAYEQRYRETAPATNVFDEFIDQLVHWRRRVESVTYTHDRYEQEVLQANDRQPRKSSKCANRTFMSEKKEHEVDILAPAIDRIANMADIDSVFLRRRLVPRLLSTLCSDH